MRLGLIARADHRGLAIQTASIHRNLHPAKTMIVDCPSAKPLPFHPEQFSGEGVSIVRGLPTAADFCTWLQDLTHVYTAETAYSHCFWDEAERAGVKTVLAVNPEFYDRNDRPTLWAAPSMWRYDQLPEPKCFLPVPITPAECRETAGGTATNFLHVVGRPATRDRNGSENLLAALQYVTAKVTVTFTCQEPGFVENLLGRFRVPANVTVVVRSGDVQCNTDLYRGQDVLLMPRRFGGLCLPVNEALGAGLPVVMTDVSPNNTWLPTDWLIPATHAGSFTVKQNRIDYYSADHRAFAAKIDALATDAGFYAKAKTEALELRDQLSWANMKQRYLEVLSGV